MLSIYIIQNCDFESLENWECESVLGTENVFNKPCKLFDILKYVHALLDKSNNSV